MIRRLLTILAAVSLALLAVTCSAWWLSFRHPYHGEHVTHFCGLGAIINSYDGDLDIEAGRATPTQIDFPKDASPRLIEIMKIQSLTTEALYGTTVKFDGRRFHIPIRIEREDYTFTYPDGAENDVDLGNPWRTSTDYWLLAVIFAVLPVGLSSVRVLRHALNRRRSLNRCSRCGYDLRATPERCPECGTIPAGAAK